MIEKNTRDIYSEEFLAYQMHVPDSITVGPTRSTIPRLHQNEDLVPVRMEVPDRLRPGLF